MAESDCNDVIVLDRTLPRAAAPSRPALSRLGSPIDQRAKLWASAGRQVASGLQADLRQASAAQSAMKPLALALEYMQAFYSERDTEALGRLLHKDLVFRGPLFEFDSAQDYMDSLRADPPRGMQYEILHSFENGSSACLIYRFSKAGVDTPMAQLFETEGGRIKRILLVFDTKAFA